MTKEIVHISHYEKPRTESLIERMKPYSVMFGMMTWRLWLAMVKHREENE